jgi:hypothetical protein
MISGEAHRRAAAVAAVRFWLTWRSRHPRGDRLTLPHRRPLLNALHSLNNILPVVNSALSSVVHSRYQPAHCPDHPSSFSLFCLSFAVLCFHNSYEMLFRQPVPFDNRTNCPRGGGGPSSNFSVRCPPLAVLTSLCFHIRSPLARAGVRTLLQASKSQSVSFHAIPHSFTKIPGRGYPPCNLSLWRQVQGRSASEGAPYKPERAARLRILFGRACAKWRRGCGTTGGLRRRRRGGWLHGACRKRRRWLRPARWLRRWLA